jgi:hypothetical protein
VRCGRINLYSYLFCIHEPAPSYIALFVLAGANHSKCMNDKQSSKDNFKSEGVSSMMLIRYPQAEQQTEILEIWTQFLSPDIWWVVVTKSTRHMENFLGIHQLIFIDVLRCVLEIDRSKGCRCGLHHQQALSFPQFPHSHPSLLNYPCYWP